MSKTYIPSSGDDGPDAKASDRRINYGTHADKYNADKYDRPQVQATAATQRPPV